MFLTEQLGGIPSTKGLKPSSKGRTVPRGKAVAIAVRALALEQATANELTKELTTFISANRNLSPTVNVSVKPGYLSALLDLNDQGDEKKVYLNG